MTKWLLPAALILVAFSSSGRAQMKESLVGTWKLVSATETNEKGEVKGSYGPNPIGFLTYTADGRMSVVGGDSRRKPLSLPTASTEERAGAFDTFFAYAGRYTVSGDRVIHHIEVCSVQAFVNTDQVRYVTLHGDRLSMRGGFVGGSVTYAAVWERLKPETTDK